ncbi:MAG: hypothetical protein J6K16_03265 [Alphaproteobacteria bacterium]|nr:hypothetical protein [Alphaproteobacteria bacterium]
MKKFLTIIVCVCSFVSTAFADDFIKVNGVTLTVNDEYTVVRTDMNEFREVKFLQAFKVVGKQTSDWADILKDKDGNYYVQLTEMNIKVSGREMEVVESVGEAEYLTDAKEFAGMADPLTKYKWIWAYDKKDGVAGSGDLYIVIYGK